MDLFLHRQWKNKYIFQHFVCLVLTLFITLKQMFVITYKVFIH